MIWDEQAKMAERDRFDLLRENAELKASNARKQEALGRALQSYCGSNESWNALRGILAETPAASLAAIQDAARAEEREACANIALSYADQANWGDHHEAETAALVIEKSIRNRGNGGDSA